MMNAFVVVAHVVWHFHLLLSTRPRRPRLLHFVAEHANQLLSDERGGKVDELFRIMESFEGWDCCW